MRGTPIDYELTHDPLWLPVTVLVALLLLLVWRTLLRPAARELAPRAVAARLPARWDEGAGRGLRETFASRGGLDPSAAGTMLLVAGLSIGVASHLVWDGLTHGERWGVAVFPVLAEAWGPWPGYRWLQHSSSVVGLAALVGAAVLWLAGRAAEPETVHHVLPLGLRLAWTVSLPLIVVAAAAAEPWRSGWRMPTRRSRPSSIARSCPRSASGGV